MAGVHREGSLVADLSLVQLTNYYTSYQLFAEAYVQNYTLISQENDRLIVVSQYSYLENGNWNEDCWVIISMQW